MLAYKPVGEPGSHHNDAAGYLAMKEESRKGDCNVGIVVQRTGEAATNRLYRKTEWDPREEDCGKWYRILEGWHGKRFASTYAETIRAQKGEWLPLTVTGR